MILIWCFLDNHLSKAIPALYQQVALASSTVTSILPITQVKHQPIVDRHLRNSQYSRYVSWQFTVLNHQDILFMKLCQFTVLQFAQIYRITRIFEFGNVTNMRKIVRIYPSATIYRHSG